MFTHLAVRSALGLNVRQIVLRGLLQQRLRHRVGVGRVPARFEHVFRCFADRLFASWADSERLASGSSGARAIRRLKPDSVSSKLLSDRQRELTHCFFT